MGARHDWHVDPTDNSPYVEYRWRTVVGYNTACREVGVNCKRLQYWSNPNKLYNNDPMGVSPPGPEEADNRKTLKRTAGTVAGFRTP